MRTIVCAPPKLPVFDEITIGNPDSPYMHVGLLSFGEMQLVTLGLN